MQLNDNCATRTTMRALLGYGLYARLVNLIAVLIVAGSVASGARAEGPVRILALGDSLTAGYGLAEPDALTSQLQAALQAQGVDVVVINGGVSGDTSAGGRARIDWLLASPVDAVIVELGANDGLRGLDPAQTRANIDWILAHLKAQGIPALLTGMQAPPNLGADYGAEFNSIYPDLAKKYGAVFDPFYLDGVAAIPALNQDDGIHPNAKGVAVIVERLVPKVLDLIARAANEGK